jgi:hypothetical protein
VSTFIVGRVGEKVGVVWDNVGNRDFADSIYLDAAGVTSTIAISGNFVDIAIIGNINCPVRIHGKCITSPQHARRTIHKNELRYVLGIIIPN